MFEGVCVRTAVHEAAAPQAPKTRDACTDVARFSQTLDKTTLVALFATVDMDPKSVKHSKKHTTHPSRRTL